MKRSMSGVVWVLVLLFAVPSHAAYEEILNIQAAPIPSGLTPQQVEVAITNGGAQRGWVVERVAPGHLLATLNIRRHTVWADIRYGATSYSITYKDSANIKFRKGKIHGAYNKWIRNLNGDIQQALQLISL